MRSIGTTNGLGHVLAALPCDHAADRGAQALRYSLAGCIDTFSRGTIETRRPQVTAMADIGAEPLAHHGRRKLDDESNQTGYTVIVVVLVVIGSIFLIALAGSCIYQACKRDRRRASVPGDRLPPAPPRSAAVELNGTASAPPWTGR